LAFISAVDTWRDLEVEKVGAVDQVVALIGFDPERLAIYKLTVSFDSGTPMYGAELNFWIDEEADGCAPETFWSGLETRFIHGADRNAVLTLVFNAVRLLLSKTEADCVAMTAMWPDLPDKALDKYLKIGEIFSEQGFSVRRNCENGYFSWLMTKS
jgi:hypothetical protein